MNGLTPLDMRNRILAVAVHAREGDRTAVNEHVQCANAVETAFREASILDLEADAYLTLHGARRGVGETLYRERGAAAAQRTLRMRIRRRPWRCTLILK